MKKTLLFIALIVSTTFFAQTNLVKNGTVDDHGTGSDTSNTSDNADAWDMTPNSTLNGGITSPYRYNSDDNPNGWYNSALADWLADNCGDADEQPGSSSDGNWDYSAGADMGVKTRGVKISEACRRLYQKVPVTSGKTYIFSMDSRSEAENIPSDVFMLNTEIADETGLDGNSSTVDAYMQITNDFNSSKSNATTNNFTTTTFEFTASTDYVVIYVRASLAVDSSNEVFYDNISLVKKEATASVDDFFSSQISAYPNPAKDFIQVSSTREITGIAMYNLIGKKVVNFSSVNNNRIDTSKLAKGIYVLKVSSNELVGTKKIIIE